MVLAGSSLPRLPEENFPKVTTSAIVKATDRRRVAKGKNPIEQIKRLALI